MRILIGAATSGSGKTTFTMGLLRVLTRRGLNVQPFKCGPDYIDTQFHTIASGRQSVNLDTWMASPEHVREVFARYSAGADVAVIEGVMGLFDGYDRMCGSSAEIAALLDVPVLLVVNARSTAYSVAALLHGMKTFRPDVRIAGVVFNQVASESHYKFLKDAAADAGVECLGWIPRAEGIEVPSRHLGLTIGMENEISSLADRVADLIEGHKGDGSFCALLKENNCKSEDNLKGTKRTVPNVPFVVAVAKDRAFNFVYRENIDRLAEMGDVKFFSPLAGDELPEADLVYLPGGYPELFAPELAMNRMLASQLVQYAERGGRILAECGGMMYLGKSLTDQDGKVWPMAGVLPIECTMQGARLHLGYRSMEINGKVFKGHEFHYSKIEQKGSDPNCTICLQRNAKGEKVDTELFRYKNVIAGYTHWYWGESDINAFWEL
ncbi:MAG: cobyrinate a,c-diamide synthase [Bacteroidaceae bacterium]|nr:cobyrinate a,c-diamide synthase [Bacteroidaceae bacterium]